MMAIRRFALRRARETHNVKHGKVNKGGGKPRQVTPKNIKHVVDKSGIAKPKPALASMSGPYNRGMGLAG